MIIREENEADIPAIADVTRAAFTNHPISQNTEEFIINALRKAKVLTISLVADDAGKIVVGQDHLGSLLGHIGSPQAHGDADICAFKGRGIVDAVTGDSDDIAQFFKGIYDTQLMLGIDPCEDDLFS